jgi:hypothetical protein
MTVYNTFARHQHLGQLSTCLGILALVFSWWNPAGMILGLAGLTLALIGWVRAQDEAGSHAWLIVGILVCGIALIVDVLAAGQGWTLVNLTSLQ